MVSMKTQIIQAVEQMDDETTFTLWDMITRHFNTPNRQISWDDIEEEEPDEWDLEMLKEIETNPECKIFISENELLAKLNIQK